MRWAPFPPGSRNALPQKQIWSVHRTPQSDSQFSAPDAQTRAGASRALPLRPTLLVPADEVTRALRGTIAVAPRRPEEDDTDNPFLLLDFAISADSESVLLIGSKSLAWYDCASHKSRTLVSGEDDLLDVSLSPDGKTVSFVRNHELSLVSSAGGAARALLTSPRPGILQGEPDWPYRNEFHVKRAYWWSPDSTRIAYLQVDDRAVASYSLRASDGSSRDIVYPKPGGSVPVVQVFVKPVGGGPTIQMNLGDTQNTYIPRVAWLPDHRHLAIQRLTAASKP